MRLRWHKGFSRGSRSKNARDRDTLCRCGVKRIHKRWKKGRHRKLCSTCGKSAERAEHMVITCRGYRDHDATRHTDTCRGTVRRPSNYVKNLSSFDRSSMTYQCNDCAGTERLHAWEEKELGKLYAKKYPHEDVSKIQSRQRRLKMRRALHNEFSPNSRQPGRLKNWDAVDLFKTRQPARNTQKKRERILEGTGSGISSPREPASGSVFFAKTSLS
jgi:hypothetical protein